MCSERSSDREDEKNSPEFFEPIFCWIRQDREGEKNSQEFFERRLDLSEGR